MVLSLLLLHLRLCRHHEVVIVLVCYRRALAFFQKVARSRLRRWRSALESFALVWFWRFLVRNFLVFLLVGVGQIRRILRNSGCRGKLLRFLFRFVIGRSRKCFCFLKREFLYLLGTLRLEGIVGLWFG